MPEAARDSENYWQFGCNDASFAAEIINLVSNILGANLEGSQKNNFAHPLHAACKNNLNGDETEKEKGRPRDSTLEEGLRPPSFLT